MALKKKTNDPEVKVEFLDLESLLQESFDCKQLRVINYTATKQSSLGESYSSILVKIDATIRRNENTKKERLQLAAKIMQEVEQPIVKWLITLIKEVFIYRELYPAYRNMEREAGIAESELVDLLPKYFGHRFSKSGSTERPDEYSTLVMENLQERGFYNCIKPIGFNVQHAKIALSGLARYHALGIALKHKRPEFFEKVMAQAQVECADFTPLYVGLDVVLEEFREDASIARDCLHSIEASFNHFRIDQQLTVSPSDPWATITHGDFWVNNIMFHQDEQGNVDDVKFVDFQMYNFKSALYELPFFFCSSLDDEAFDRHLDQLIGIYYEAFVKELECLGVDASIYTRESFDRELKKQAFNIFPSCALAPKFILLEINEEHTSEKLLGSVFESKCGRRAKNKMRRIVSTYAERGWFL